MRTTEQTPVIFINGFIGTLKCQLDEQAFSGWPIAAPDLLGYGRQAERAVESIDIAAQVEHLGREIARQFGESKVHLVGHSVGGVVAYLFALRHPERVMGLVSVEGNFSLKDAFWSSSVARASSIDYLMQHPEQSEKVHAWYNRSYSETYNQYHEFLASFYTFASFTEPASEFWTKRRISESADERLKRKEWFEQLVNGEKQNRPQIGDFKDRASTMIAIGRHQREGLTDEFMDAELNPARVRWISDLTKQLNRIVSFSWLGDQVETADYFKIEPLSFKLSLKQILSNGAGKDMTEYTVSDALVQLFKDLNEQGFGYKELMVRLNDVGEVNSSQFVIRLMEAGLLDGFDKQGQKVLVQDRLRFDGVGVEYEV